MYFEVIRYKPLVIQESFYDWVTMSGQLRWLLCQGSVCLSAVSGVYLSAVSGVCLSICSVWVCLSAVSGIYLSAVPGSVCLLRRGSVWLLRRGSVCGVRGLSAVSRVCLTENSKKQFLLVTG